MITLAPLHPVSRTLRPLCWLLAGWLALQAGLADDDYSDAFQRGDSLYRARNWMAAAQAYEHAALLARTPVETCNAYLRQGHSLRQAGDPARARETFARVLKVDGVQAAFVYQACMASAQCASHTRDYRGAVRIYLDLLSIQELSTSQRCSVYLRLASVYSYLNQTQAAVQVCQRALELPNLSVDQRCQILINLGNYLYTQNDFDDARARYRQVVDLPNAPAEKVRLATQRIGLTWYGEKEYDKAADFLRKMTDSPAVPGRLMAESVLYLGLCYLQENKVAEARAELERIANIRGAAKWHLDAARAQLDRLDRMAKAR